MPTDSQGYAALLRRARAGSRPAFDVIQRSLQGRVCSFVHHAIGDDPEAEDLVQEAFLSLWVNLGRIRSEEHLLPYLYRIVRNLCYDRLRHRQRTRSLFDRDGEAGTAVGLAQALAGPAADEVVHWKLLGRRVEQAMEKLPPCHREALHLRFREGFSYEQLAEATGVDLGTVKSRLHHARRLLAALLPSEVRRALGLTQGAKP